MGQHSAFISPLSYVSAPRTVHVTIAAPCTWRCVFCTQHENTGPIYPLETIKKVIEQLANAGVVDITLYGGEPTIHPDFLEIGRYAKGLGLTVGFISNGSGITEKNYEDIVQIFDHGAISVHGFRLIHEAITRTPGSYKSAIRAVKLLDSEGFNLAVNVTVTTINLFLFDRFIHYLWRRFPSVQSFIVNRASYTGVGKEYCLNVGEIVEMVRRMDLLSKEGIPVRAGVPIPPCILPEELRHYSTFCSAGVEFADVLGNGELKMCGSLGPSKTLGNVLKQPLSEIWNSEYLLKFRSFDWIPEKCKGCPYFRYCFVGCKLQVDGTYGPDPIIFEEYSEFYVLHPRAKARTLNKCLAYTAPYSLTLAFCDDLSRALVTSLQTPVSMEDLISVAKKNGGTAEDVHMFLDYVLRSGLVVRVYRKDISNYTIPIAEYRNTAVPL